MTRAEDHTVCEKAGPRTITIVRASKGGDSQPCVAGCDGIKMVAS